MYGVLPRWIKKVPSELKDNRSVKEVQGWVIKRGKENRRDINNFNIAVREEILSVQGFEKQRY